VPDTNSDLYLDVIPGTAGYIIAVVQMTNAKNASEPVEQPAILPPGFRIQVKQWLKKRDNWIAFS